MAPERPYMLPKNNQTDERNSQIKTKRHRNIRLLFTVLENRVLAIGRYVGLVFNARTDRV